jgi:hypothetical protein
MKETDTMFTAGSIYTDSGAWLAIGATLVSALALVALHFLSPQLQPSWRMVSEYANGNHRWVTLPSFDVVHSHSVTRLS